MGFESFSLWPLTTVTLGPPPPPHFEMRCPSNHYIIAVLLSLRNPLNLYQTVSLNSFFTSRLKRLNRLMFGSCPSTSKAMREGSVITMEVDSARAAGPPVNGAEVQSSNIETTHSVLAGFPMVSTPPPAPKRKAPVKHEHPHSLYCSWMDEKADEPCAFHSHWTSPCLFPCPSCAPQIRTAHRAERRLGGLTIQICIWKIDPGLKSTLVVGLGTLHLGLIGRHNLFEGVPRF